MKRRAWKVLGLAACGGLLLQAGGCPSYLIDTIATNIVPLLLSLLVEQALGSSTT